jgi:hypothetical protein
MARISIARADPIGGEDAHARLARLPITQWLWVKPYCRRLGFRKAIGAAQVESAIEAALRHSHLDAHQLG